MLRPKFIFEEQTQQVVPTESANQKLRFQTEISHQNQIQLEPKLRVETQAHQIPFSRNKPQPNHSTNFSSIIQQQKSPVPNLEPSKDTAELYVQNQSLKYNRIQTHEKKGDKGEQKLVNLKLSKKIESSGNYEQKIQNHLDVAKQMKPNLFFREDNQSPIPQANASRLTILPKFTPIEFDPYKYVEYGKNKKSKKKQYQILLDNSKKKKENQKEKEKQQKIEQKINDCSHVQLQIQPEQSSVDQNSKQKERVIIDIPKLNQPTPYSFLIQKQCGVNYLYPTFKIVSPSGKTEISSKKQPFHLNSYYNLYEGSGESQKVGYVKGSFGGTEFNIYQTLDNTSTLIATVVYKAQFSCNAFRQMQVYVMNPKSDQNGFESTDKNLKQMYEGGKTEQIMKIITKQPVWRSDLQIYVMSFKGKGKISSTKNTRLINSVNKADALLFCKTQYNKYYLEVCQPLNLLVSMGILMSSFDFKLLCQ